MAIRYMVFMKFKKDANKKGVETFVEELNKIPDLDREVKNWVSGFAPKQRFLNGDFDFGFTADFPDADTLDRYMYHFGHTRMRQFAAPVIEYMLGFQFNMDYVSPKRFPARAKVAKPRQSRLPQGKVAVPDLNMHRLEEARQLLKNSGLKVGGVTPVTKEMLAAGKVAPVAAAGRVVGQEPAKETVVEKWSAVNLIITGEFWMKPQMPY